MTSHPKTVRPELVEGPSFSSATEKGKSDPSTSSGQTAFENVRGKLTPQAPLAPLVWFKSGGSADWLFEPKDADDLADFLCDLDPVVPVMALGLGSNLIVSDGGFPGVVVRLGKAFAKVEAAGETTLRCGGGASGILVSSTARDAGIAGMEFLRSIPGTVGGFVRMNGGAYGGEVKDILIDADIVLRSATPIATANSPKARSSSARPSAAVPARRKPSKPKWTASRRAAKRRSLCARRPAARPSRTPTAIRPGNWSTKPAAAG